MKRHDPIAASIEDAAAELLGTLGRGLSSIASPNITVAALWETADLVGAQVIHLRRKNGRLLVRYLPALGNEV